MSTNDFTNSLKSKIENNELDISAIIEKISNLASSSNKLLSESEINDRVLAQAARPITKTASGEPFNTYSELINASAYYSGGELITLTKNDYAVVVGDESNRIYTIYLDYIYFTSTSEYIDYAIEYNGSKVIVTTSNKDSLGIVPGTTIAYDFEDPTTRYVWFNNWQFQYIINSTTLTPQQIVAINSGITRALTDQITTNKNNITTILGEIEDILSDIESIEDTLATKVDKETGKGLSTNDFSDTFKNDVNLNTGARHSHANKDILDSIGSSEIVSVEDRTNWNGKQNELTFDDTPTQSSNNPVKSSGVKSYVDNVATTLQLKITSSNKLSSDLVNDANSTNKFVTSQEKTNIASNTSARHSHSNKDILDNINFYGLKDYTGTKLTVDDTYYIQLNKSHVGLSNVDNTSDANKPISTATQGALDTINSTLSSHTSSISSLNTAVEQRIKSRTDVLYDKDLNDYHTSAPELYILGSGCTNGPSGVSIAWNHFMVYTTADITTQIIYVPDAVYIRHGNGDPFVWQSWHKVGELGSTISVDTINGATHGNAILRQNVSTGRVVVGSDAQNLQLLGNQTRPKYTTSVSQLGSDLALYSDLSSYLPKSGGTMTGTLLGSTSANIGNSSTGRFGTIYATNLNGDLPYCSTASGTMYNPSGHFKVVVTSTKPSSFSSNVLYIITN